MARADATARGARRARRQADHGRLRRRRVPGGAQAARRGSGVLSRDRNALADHQSPDGSERGVSCERPPDVRETRRHSGWRGDARGFGGRNQQVHPTAPRTVGLLGDHNRPEDQPHGPAPYRRHGVRCGETDDRADPARRQRVRRSHPGVRPESVCAIRAGHVANPGRAAR